MKIITPSVTLHKANFMELLFIPIQTADTQKEMVNFLESNEYPILKEFDSETPKHLESQIEIIQDDVNKIGDL